MDAGASVCWCIDSVQIPEDDGLRAWTEGNARAVPRTRPLAQFVRGVGRFAQASNYLHQRMEPVVNPRVDDGANLGCYDSMTSFHRK